MGQPLIDCSVGGSGSGSESGVPVGSSVGVAVSLRDGVALVAVPGSVSVSVVLQPASPATPVTPSDSRYSRLVGRLGMRSVGRL